MTIPLSSNDQGHRAMVDVGLSGQITGSGHAARAAVVASGEM
ncbi:hypothetical protein [Celeribacter sp.]